MHSRLRRSFPIISILVLAAGVRFAFLNLPFLESYNSMTRQVIGAQIARNFFRNGFNFFYPEIDANGPGISLFVGEMPFVPYLASLLYAISGSVNEAYARLVGVIFSLLGLWIFYRLTKKLAGRSAALWATAFVAFSPLSVALARTLQPEPLMGFASLGFVFFSYKYRNKRRLLDAGLAAFFLFVAVGAKFYNVYLLIFVAPWYWNALRQGVKKAALANIAVALSLGASLLWSVCMWHYGRYHQVFYNAFQFVATRGPAGSSYFELLLSPHYLTTMGKGFSLHLLTVPAFLLWMYSWFCANREMGIRIARQWMLASMLLILIIWRTAIDHPYYQYPILFPAAILAGWAMASVLKKNRSKMVRAILIGVFLAMLVANSAYLYRGLYAIPSDKKRILIAAKEVRSKVPVGDLLLASHWTNEMLLYYCDRKGWSFSLVGVDDVFLIEELERKRAQGAKYYVTSTPEDLRAHPEFERYLNDKYVLLSQSENYLLYRL